jgi:hypothetical protein
MIHDIDELITSFPDCDHPWGFSIQGQCCRCGRDLSRQLDAAMEAEEKSIHDFAEQIAGTDLDIRCEVVGFIP